MKLWGLADGNNFYASVERLLRPDLIDKPLAILSNNDGCVIARSNEIKALGVKMGTPIMDIRKDIDKGIIVPFSSNYENYGEMHSRLMHTLSRFTPEWEIYSVDECWLLFDGFEYDMNAYGRHIVKEAWRLTGIPVSIGLAPTKTLAKVANKLAKKDKTCKGCRVLQYDHEITIALNEFPVNDLWGVGFAKAKRLINMGVTTALEFRQLPGEWVKKHFTITGFRMWRELHGYPCYELEHESFNKENIATGRTFGKLLTNYNDVEEALTNHATSCAAKLRKQKSVTGFINVQIETNKYRTDLPQYINHINAKMSYPTADTRLIVKTCVESLKKIWKDGYHYNRCSVLLMDLRDAKTGAQVDIFNGHDDERIDSLMKTLDDLNARYGKNKVKMAIQGYGKEWHLKANYLSPNYLTKVSDFIKLKI